MTTVVRRFRFLEAVRASAFGSSLRSLFCPAAPPSGGGGRAGHARCWV